MPDWNAIVRDRIASLRLNPVAESALAEELAQHLEDRYRELRSGGASEEEAYRGAVAELDDLYPIQTELRRVRMPIHDPVPAGDPQPDNVINERGTTGARRARFFETLWRDLRYTGRTMRKSPSFVLFVVLTLALGIGANTTVFTLINTLILNPLPVKNSSGLTVLAGAEAKTTSKSKTLLPISYADLKDFRDRNDVFSSLAGYTSPQIVTFQAGTSSQRMFSELVTGNYFSTLGLEPALGRFFLPEEDSTPGGHAVAVMNYATWQARFGGAKDIIGKTLRLNNVVFTVIAIAPPKFIGVNLIFGPDLWIPAAMSELLHPNQMQGALSDRGKAFFLGLGRLKFGISRAEAQADLTNIASELAREYPNADQGRTATATPMRDAISSPPVIFGSFGLLLVVGIVLLIACSNVANLLMARSAARQQEVAVRLAMGASRARLVRQLLTESVSLGLLSGLVGLAIGYGALQLLWSFLPAEVLSNLMKPNMNAMVFLFALIVSLLTGFVFGTVPALQASRTSVAETLKEETRTTGKSRRKITFANALLAGQVAFSFLLLVTAGHFLRSLGRAYDINPGFEIRHLAVVLTNPGEAGYGIPQTKAFYKEVRGRVATLPGVQSVSWASNMPFWESVQSGFQVEGREQRSKSDLISAVRNTVDINYFETAGIAIDKGREFTAIDQANTAPVAIINEKMAHDYWPNGEALGKRIQLPGEKQLRQIVGIAKTVNYSTLGEPPQYCVYEPLTQNYSDAMTLYVRSKGDPREILLSVQREVRAIALQVSSNDARTGHTLLDNVLFQGKMGVALLSVFGLLALGLASIGLYGIMAYSVSQRKREIGVRMALGAARQTVVRLILKQGMSVVLSGVLIGLVAALLVGRLLGRMLYGVSPGDPISVVGAALVLLAVALLACYLPARWASRVDPLVALREG
ncbi:MAG: ABC transporter permease [Acidobacteriaceae bacterium]|nr:ABC transporter permease [Acidobacteriaceae bacterium]